MSGSEISAAYMREKRGGDGEPTIIVDTREANTAARIVTGLREQGVDVEVEALQKGDYVLSEVCAVERKTVQDFAYTLTRRRLFEQLFTLKEVYPKAIIILEGYLPVIYRFTRIRPASVWGAMFNLAKNGVAMINTTSQKETVDLLCTAARQEQLVEKRAPVVHPVKKCQTASDAQLFLMASLPNIGREKATAILNHYETPLNALANVDGWPKTVHGLGSRTSKKAKEVLTTPFKK